MTKTMRNAPDRRRIVLVAYDGAQRSSILGLQDIFLIANRFAEGRLEVVCTILEPIHRSSAAARADAVVVPPNLSGARGTEDRALHRWLVDRHDEGATICSACAGAFWLGHAGLLDGRPVTTHWALEDVFSAAFPRARLHPERLLIDDHDIVTAGGAMAWVDLGLLLVRRFLGPEAVSRTCRQMLIEPGGREQRNYRSFRPRVDHGDDAIRDLQRWMEGNAAGDLSLRALASRARMSERSLQRRLKRATGLSPKRYAQELRIEKARGLLERTGKPVAEICWDLGYDDPSAFARLFRETTGLTPGAYRRRFRIA